MIAPDCVLIVGGEQFADTGAALRAGQPTALAEVEVVWGRDTTVDQPSAGTCHAVIEDRSGGSSFLTSVLDVGAQLEVTATGDIATHDLSNVVTDPGFETLPPGAITNGRVAVQTGSAASVTAPVHSGAQAVAYDPATPSWLLLPPAPFSSDPTAWDAIPRYVPGAPWSWQLAVLPDRFQSVTVSPVLLAGPTFPTPGAYLGAGVTIEGDGTWHVIDNTTSATGVPSGWLGLRVQVGPRPPWTVVPQSWQTVPGTWMDYRGVVVDDETLAVPVGEPVWRPALVFSGVVTDLAATMDQQGTLRVEVTAVDQLAELENRAVGDVPWPAETLRARVDHVLADLGGIATARIDPPLDAEIITWQDVDHQPAASLLAGYAQGVDGVLWSATHATTGPYLWIENPTQRAQVGELELQGALVVIVYVDEDRGSTSLDGCLLPVEPITWVRDVGDVITRVDAQWSEQTLDDGGLPAPTDRTVTVDAAPEVIAKHGVRRYAVTTNLISEAAAEETAQRILNRSTTLEWHAGGLELDLAVTPPGTGDDVATVLDLLDGTSRLGRALIVDDADYWPGSDTVGLYLEGGSYTYDGAWRLALNCSSHTGMGASVLWNELDPAWSWPEFDPAIRWFDLYGVAA